MITSFPDRCIHALTKVLAAYRLQPVEFAMVKGKYEKYWYAKIVRQELSVELYVYIDEAGCALNKDEWVIFEKWDFRSDEELISAFVDHVINVLTNDPKEKKFIGGICLV